MPEPTWKAMLLVDIRSTGTSSPSVSPTSCFCANTKAGSSRTKSGIKEGRLGKLRMVVVPLLWKVHRGWKTIGNSWLILGQIYRLHPLAVCGKSNRTSYERNVVSV